MDSDFLGKVNTKTLLVVETCRKLS